MLPVLMPVCAAFRDTQPKIRVEVVVANQFLNLSRRDADVALRPSRTPPETLVGRRLADIATAVYAPRAEAWTAWTEENFLAGPWIGFDDSLGHLASAGWLHRAIGQERIVLRANSLVAMLEAARADIGLALLPCFMGDAEPVLRRVTPPMPDLRTDLWLLVHEDLRHTARIRTFMDFVSAEFASLRPLLQGQASDPRP